MPRAVSEGDADADINADVLAPECDRHGQCLLYPGGNEVGVAAVAEALAQDHELVAAEPGDRVTWPDCVAKPPRDCDEEAVASIVAEAVVHRLETVEVAEQDCDRRRRPRQAGEGEAEPVGE